MSEWVCVEDTALEKLALLNSTEKKANELSERIENLKIKTAAPSVPVDYGI